VIADSFGRAWRLGQADVAIGCAGLRPLHDRRGDADHAGRGLTATVDAVADQAAAAAALARDKAGREAVVVVRGLERHVTDEDGPGAAAIIRPLAEDLFT
jgi:coenzyme F420-0:L-glutamate ligase/coenzyme F420-1:gamma-L-glutamate ligase